MGEKDICMLDKEIQHEVYVQTRVCQVDPFHLTL